MTEFDLDLYGLAFGSSESKPESPPVGAWPLAFAAAWLIRPN
jgi:hypothetical protein